MTNQIIQLAALCGALAALIGFAYKVFKFYERQRAQDQELEDTNSRIDGLLEEQQVMCYGILACLDGLKQLGANGNVTDAHDKLSKHINKAAHRGEGGRYGNN